MSRGRRPSSSRKLNHELKTSKTERAIIQQSQYASQLSHYPFKATLKPAKKATTTSGLTKPPKYTKSKSRNTLNRSRSRMSTSRDRSQHEPYILQSGFNSSRNQQSLKSFQSSKNSSKALRVPAVVAPIVNYNPSRASTSQSRLGSLDNSASQGILNLQLIKGTIKSKKGVRETRNNVR